MGGRLKVKNLSLQEKPLSYNGRLYLKWLCYAQKTILLHILFCYLVGKIDVVAVFN